MNSYTASPWKKEISRDCLRHMSGAVSVRFFLDLTALAVPSATAGIIGDMTDSLLLLRTDEIMSRLPLFLVALAINVAGVPLLQLLENLLLTVNGFSYDRYLVARYLRLPLSQTQQYDPSVVVTRCETDVTNYYFHQIYRFTRPLVLALYFLFLGITVWQKQYPVGLVALLSLAAFPVLHANRVGKSASRLTAESAQYQEERRALEHMLFQGQHFLRDYDLMDCSLQKADKLFRRYMDHSGRKMASLKVINSLVSLLGGYLVQIIILIAGSILIAFGQCTAGALLACTLLLPSITKACTYATEWVLAVRAEPEDQKRMEFFYGEIEPEEDDSVQHVQALQIRNVTFSYPGNTQSVLKNISFNIPASGCVWLRGDNGSGKSTLLSLLCGLHAPSSGQILRDGQPISSSALRRITAYQEQTGAIFSVSIGENLFAPSVPQEEQVRLMKELGLQKPLDYAVAPQGANLSPGERKKILLGRALLKNAPFLVLDEPDNHLDPAARAALKRLLRQRRSGIVLVSHQPPASGEDGLPVTAVLDMKKRP